MPHNFMSNGFLCICVLLVSKQLKCLKGVTVVISLLLVSDFAAMFLCSIDATAEPAHARKLGRLVNHSKKHRTACPRLVTVSGVPHLCLFATKHMSAGEQLLYDYGVKLPFFDLVSTCLLCSIS